MSSTVQTQSSYLPTSYLSGGLSISGLGNGTDFTTMIDQLRQIEMIPTQRMLRWKSEWRERQEAFKVVREQLVALRDACSKMNTMDKFLVKNAATSKSDVATATASSSAIENSYKLNVNKVATTSIWSLENTFYDGKDNINTTGTTQTFSYEYKGTVRTINVEANTTLESFKNLINNDSGNPGVRASIINGSNGATLQIKGMDQGAKNDLSIISTGNLTGFPTSGAPMHSIEYTTQFTNSTDKVNESQDTKIFTFAYKGVKHNVGIPHNTTIDGMKTAIQDYITNYNSTHTSPDDIDITVDLTDTSGRQVLSFASGTPGEAITLPTGSTWEKLGKPTTTSGDPASGWHIQHSQNAEIKVDGWPTSGWLEVDSNTVSNVVDGVTFTLIGEGEATVSVNTDAEGIQENVMGFIEAVNTFRATILELTKYDENKVTYDLQYAQSLFEMQKGSILTGNYGVQLLSSQLKQATAGMPKGFMPRFEVDGIFRGDLFTSLSQIGIKTNATGQGGDMFGMLVLNDDPSMPILSDVLSKNPQAVAEFFAAVNMGVSDSPNFSYSSSVQNLTRPGAYEVNYTISTVAGKKVVTGTINGKEAKWDPLTGQFGFIRTGPQSANKNAVDASFTDDCDFDVEIDCTQIAKKASYSYDTDVTWANKGSQFVADGGGGVVTYDYNGQTYSVNVEEKESLAMIAARINYSTKNPGVTARVVNDGGTCKFIVESNKEGDADGSGGPKVTNIDFSGINTGSNTVSNGTATNGQDAVYKYRKAGEASWTNGTSKSNTLTKVVSGVTFTLKQDNVGPVNVTGKKYNDADGLYIQIDNMADGTYNGGQVRLKQGKVPELLEMLNGTSSKPEEGMLGSKGAIQVLLDNYDKIVASIDKKISKETDRLTKWERLTKLRFSRLDATLKQYDSLQSMVESQVKQLGNNSSK